jgi:hypothetical protein
MKLFLLHPIDIDCEILHEYDLRDKLGNIEHHSYVGKVWGCDCAEAAVIRATSEEDARKLMTTVAGDEGKDVWLDASMTLCTEITGEGKEEVLVVDFFEP